MFKEKLGEKSWKDHERLKTEVNFESKDSDP